MKHRDIAIAWLSGATIQESPDGVSDWHTHKPAEECGYCLAFSDLTYFRVLSPFIVAGFRPDDILLYNDTGDTDENRPRYGAMVVRLREDDWTNWPMFDVLSGGVDQLYLDIAYLTKVNV